MPKTTLIIILIVQLTTRPTLATPEDWIKEILVFLVAVILGSGLRVAMKAKSREKMNTREVGLIFFFGVSLGAVANYLMIFYDLRLPRPLIVWAVSLMGEFIVLWLEKRNIKILDSLFKKGTGIDLSDKKEEEFIDKKDYEE